MGIDYLVWPPVCAYFIAAYVLYPIFSYMFFGTFQCFPDEANGRQWFLQIALTIPLTIGIWIALGIGSSDEKKS